MRSIKKLFRLKKVKDMPKEQQNMVKAHDMGLRGHSAVQYAGMSEDDQAEVNKILGLKPLKRKAKK